MSLQSLYVPISHLLLQLNLPKISSRSVKRFLRFEEKLFYINFVTPYPENKLLCNLKGFNLKQHLLIPPPMPLKYFRVILTRAWVWKYRNQKYRKIVPLCYSKIMIKALYRFQLPACIHITLNYLRKDNEQ